VHLNALLQKHFRDIFNSFYSNINRSHSLFILGREVDQEVQLVQVYF